MNRTSVFARVVFVFLIVATFTAFFVAQRLKRVEPLVNSVQMSRFISPNRDGVRDRGYVRFRLKKADRVSVQVIDSAGSVARTLVLRRQMRAGSHRYFWNGRNTFGTPVADGSYRVRVALLDRGRGFVPNKTFRIDTQPPHSVVAAIKPPVITPGTRGAKVRVRYSGVDPERRAEFLVYKTRGGFADREPVASFAGERGVRRAFWDGTVGRFVKRKPACFGRLVTHGQPRLAKPGSYVIAVRACDSAGNAGTGPAKLPPTPTVSGKPGVAVEYLEIAPNPSPARRGKTVSFVVNSRVGAYSYRLRRVGDASVVARGKDRGPRLTLRVPRSAGNGLYTVTVAAKGPRGIGRVAAQAPVAVTGARSPVLVVLPAVAWQALNPVDRDADGFGDALDRHDDRPSAETLRWSRSLAGANLPPGFASREAAIVRFLDAAGLRYEVTTDFELTVNAKGQLARRRAVLFAGDERWLSPALGLALRSYVERGGKVASFGLESFRRTVSLSVAGISDVSPHVQRDIFGEAVSVEQIAPAPAIPYVSQLPLFAEPVGLFKTFEGSRLLAGGATPLAAAGRRPERPALVAYRLGRGLVIRIGVTGWGTQLDDPNRSVARTTLRIWQELSK